MSPPSLQHAPIRSPVAPLLSQPVDRQLVTCPTPGCGCYPLRADRVNRHLARCPQLVQQRALAELGIYSPAVNVGKFIVDDETPASSTPLLDATAFQRRIVDAHAHSMRSILSHTPAAFSPVAVDAMSVREAERERHRTQRKSIASYMHSMGLLGRGHRIVEMGAGNAQLSLAIARQPFVPVSHDSFILLDKQKPRRSADDQLTRLGLQVERFRVGLEDLDLYGLMARDASTRPSIVISKHLCGAATDFALNAIAATAARDARMRPAAVVLGSCCHHRCEWRSYPNRPFLADLGFTSAADFDALCRVSSRGVDPHDRSERARTGRLAKDLLDWGRAEFLRAAGYRTVRLHTYVDASVSPENVLIICVD